MQVEISYGCFHLNLGMVFELNFSILIKKNVLVAFLKWKRAQTASLANFLFSSYWPLKQPRRKLAFLQPVGDHFWPLVILSLLVTLWFCHSLVTLWKQFSLRLMKWNFFILWNIKKKKNGDLCLFDHFRQSLAIVYALPIQDILMSLTTPESSNLVFSIKYKLNILCGRNNVLHTFELTDVSKILRIWDWFFQKPNF